MRWLTRTPTGRIILATSWAFALLALPVNAQDGDCEFECDPNHGACAEMVPAEVTICSSSHASILQRARRSCVLKMVGDGLYLGVNDTVTVFAPTLGYVPRCPAARSGAGVTDGGVVQLARRVGDLDFAEQQDSYTEEASFYDMYHVHEDMRRRWLAMARRCTDVRIEVIGQSFQGRDIEMLRIGQTNDSAPKRVFINALQHAREWASTMTVTYIADQLTNSLLEIPGVEGKFTAEMAEVKKLLRNVEVLIVPIANPDGYIFTRTSRFHRKNMRTNDGSSCTGVDLNRNWAKDYNGGQSASSFPCDDIFIGDGAFSEPETAAMRNVIQGSKGVLAQIDYHAYGGMILGPWSFSGTEIPPADAVKWQKFSNFIEKGMADVRGTKYRTGLGNENILPYYASGVLADWTYAKGLMSATIEVHPVTARDVNLGLTGFALDVAGMRESCQDNFGGFTGLLRFADQATSPDTSKKYINSTSSTDTGSNNNSNADTEGSDSDRNSGGSALRNGATGLSNAAYIGIAVGFSLLVLVIVFAAVGAYRVKAETSQRQEMGV